MQTVQMWEYELSPQLPLQSKVQNWLDILPSTSSPITRNPLESILNVPSERKKSANQATKDNNALGCLQGGEDIVPTKRCFEIAMDEVNQTLTTPPAKRPALTSHNELPARAQLELLPQVFNPPSSTVSDMNAASTTDSIKAPSRSSSPIRKADFKNYSPRIDFRDKARVTDEEDRNFPRAILAVTKHPPKALEGKINGHPSMKDAQESPNYKEHERSLTELIHLWEFALRIFDNARMCELGEYDEEEWSDKVVLKLLEFSNEWGGFQKTMTVMNLKSVRVSPTDLLPKNKKKTVVGKKVDYGFCPEHIDGEEEKIDNVLSGTQLPGDQNNRTSISQATVPKLRTHSLSFLLEIKKASEALDPAPQIAVWACASLTKMAMLKRIALGRVRGSSANDPSVRDPCTLPIPCVTVEGHYWNIYMAKRCSNTLIEIQGPFLEFKTDTVLGIIRIVLALVEIQKWGTSTYRQWMLNIIDELQS